MVFREGQRILESEIALAFVVSGDRAVPKMLIQPRVDPFIYRSFKRLCHAHGITVEHGIEQAMIEVLERAGIPVARDEVKAK